MLELLIMIPKFMDAFLKEALPERTWRSRMASLEGQCFMEFSAIDVERLARLGIAVDQLGPKLVACMWDEASPLEVGGYLVVDNLAMGRPAMGGIRMLPDLTPAEVFYRARGMTLKNAAADLPYGGGKAGLIADPNLPDDQRSEVISRFARLLLRYCDIFLPGPDVGTHSQDMKRIAVQNGLDMALSKPLEMGGNRLDEIGAAGGGLVIALEALIQELPRLRSLPQFAKLQTPEPDQITVLVQGFGAVGANAARLLTERLPQTRVVGVSDTTGYLYDEWGLPIDQLFGLWKEHRSVSHNFYQAHIEPGHKTRPKYGTSGDDLLRESAFCLIPAAPVANYLDTDLSTEPSITVDAMGRWAVIIEGANTYSPAPASLAARNRMERVVYRERGVMIATDFLVNSGAVIYAAQENRLQTPSHLQIPEDRLGNVEAVDIWLAQHKDEFEALAQKRRDAARQARDEVIRRNIHEMVNLLIADPDLLPSEAAERISIGRISKRERSRTAAELMLPAITVRRDCSIQDAALDLIDTGSSMLAIVDEEGRLAGVVTQWDVTRAAADGLDLNQPIGRIMTREVIAANTGDTLIEVVRKLEYYEISAIPVVEENKVLGIINTDLLARQALLPLLLKP
jgi:glutamate dehydrogenase/leucine dehydrogenase/CBS domain-containing protein